MRLIFAGTPVFAERALASLIDTGHEIALVLTRTDRPAGRGQQLQSSPVKRLALARGLPVFQPRTLRDPEVQSRIAETRADVMVVAAYGLILPPEVLNVPRLGCINIHASLLPRWRGAAPIQRAIEAGDRETGITIMQMDEGLDTGAILLARAIPIAEDETGGGLHDRLAALGAGMIVEALEALARDLLRPVAQPVEGATYAAKIEKAQTEIDWRRPAPALEDQVRAFDPFPGTLAKLADASGPLKLWQAKAVGCRTDVEPGTVIGASEGELVIACGEGALSLLELQRPGGRRMPVRDFLRGFPIAAGARFALPQA